MLLPSNLKRNVLNLQIYAKAAALNIMEGGGGAPPVEAVKFNNIMNIINIINIINMLLISKDLAATGEIITCTGKKEDPTLHGPHGRGAQPP